MTIHATFDRYGRKPTREAKVEFTAAKSAERNFLKQMLKIADQVSHYVGVVWEYDIKAVLEIYTLLARYAQMIGPWAEAAIRRMHAEIGARNLTQWNAYMEQLGAGLEREIREAPIGARMRELMNEQVHLIKSIPLNEAKRVHEMTMKGLTEGVRYDDVRDAILRSNDVTRARATLIARTETSRTSSILTQVRAEAVGSTTYVWRTARDGRVRPSHKRLEGTTHSWDNPPLCDAPDYHAHPGCIFNCRCHATPIIPLR